MTASRQELQPVIDQLLELLGIRMSRSGQVVLHFNSEGKYSLAQVKQWVRPHADNGHCEDRLTFEQLAELVSTRALRSSELVVRFDEHGDFECDSFTHWVKAIPEPNGLTRPRS